MSVQIGALPAAASLNGTDQFPINVAGVTKRGTVSQLAAFASGNIYGTYGARPAAAAAGRIYTPSDGFCQSVDTGAAWKNIFQGVACGAPPAAATLTALNTPSGMTFADDKGTLLFQQPTIGAMSSVLGLVRLPALLGAPFHLRIGYAFNCIPANDVGWGVFQRDSATGRILNFYKIFDASATKWFVQNFTNATTFSSTQISDTFPGYVNFERGFFHFIDPGGAGTISFGQTQDGDKNSLVPSETGISRTSWTATPDQFGIVLYTNNTAGARGALSLRILGWDLL